jgi:hypothetical protein
MAWASPSPLRRDAPAWSRVRHLLPLGQFDRRPSLIWGAASSGRVGGASDAHAAHGSAHQSGAPAGFAHGAVATVTGASVSCSTRSPC